MTIAINFRVVPKVCLYAALKQCQNTFSLLGDFRLEQEHSNSLGEEGKPLRREKTLTSRPLIVGKELSPCSICKQCIKTLHVRKGRPFRKHQFQGVRMKLVLKSCCSIRPTWTNLALLSRLTCREHGVRETTISAVVLE